MLTLNTNPKHALLGGVVFWFNAVLISVSRLWHTACASEEGEVIVFGGCANNLLAHSKAVSLFRALPSCAGAVVSYHSSECEMLVVSSVIS